MGLPGHYNAPQIKYLIILAHSATHPFRNESAREAIVGSTLSLFCQNRRSKEKKRFSRSVFLGRHNPVPTRPSAVPSSCISTVKQGPCLHSYMGEVLATVARDDRQSCCWDTARTGTRDCTGSGGDWQRVFQEASSTSGTAPHLAQHPQTGFRALPKPAPTRAHPVPRHTQQGKSLEVPMCRCTSSLDRSARLDYYFDFLFLF